MAQYEVAFAGGGQSTVIETAETLEALARDLSNSGFVIGRLIQSLGRDPTGTREVAIFKGQVLTIKKLRD